MSTTFADQVEELTAPFNGDRVRDIVVDVRVDLRDWRRKRNWHRPNVVVI